eukprot:68685_1
MSLSCIFWIFVVNKWLLMTFADDCECTSDDRRDFARLLSSVTHYIKGVDASYDEQRLDQFAAVFGTLEQRNEIINPTIIIKPETEDEIQQIIKYARLCEYTISIKSGGHSYSGLSSCNSADGKCIQIHMEHFQDITFLKQDKNNPDLITSIVAGVGLNVKQLYDAVNEYNVSIIGGICDDVGVGGHYQSSAHGRWSGSLGMGLDYVKRIKIITSDGIIRNLYRNSDNKNEKDLFWAILGGSPGSWGVVTEYEFQPIRNSDYPYSSFYSFAHFYTKSAMKAFFTQFIDLLNNPYFDNYNDITTSFIGGPLLPDLSASESIIGNGMLMNLAWSGVDNGNIHSVIPDHPMTKTWYEELVQPFVDIHETFAAIEMPGFGYQGEISISRMLLDVGSMAIVPIPAFRYVNSHAAYSGEQLNQLFSDAGKTIQWIDSIINKFDELAGDSEDNIEILWQFSNLFRNEGNINDDIIISYDVFDNDVSWPLRSMKFETDNWILFGNGDNYSDDVISKAKQYKDELEKILTANEIKSDIKSFAYTDLKADEYDLNTQFNQFYNYREDVYKKLQEIKTNVDWNNIFQGPLTIPTK